MTRRRIVVIVAVLMAVAIAGVGVWYLVRRNSPEKVLGRCFLALQVRDFPKALDYALQYKAKRPQDWHGYYAQAQAYMGLARYSEAREPLEAALKFEPKKGRLWLSLADTFALQAKRNLNSGGPTKVWMVEDIRKNIEAIQEGNKHLTGLDLGASSSASADDRRTAEASNLDVQEYLGLNEIQIGAAYKLMQDRLDALAEQAEKTALVDIVKDRRAEAKRAGAEAEKATQAGMDRLMQVVLADPKRSRAEVMLIELGQQRNNEAVLDKVRQALKTTTTPPPTPTMMLIVHELRTQSKDSTPSEMRPRFLASAKELDALLEKHKEEAKRMGPSELAAREMDMQQVKLVRAELALLLGDLSLAETLANDVLKTDARRAQARFIHASVVWQRGNVVDAERELYNLKTDFPRWPRAQFAYAQVALQVNKKDLARDALRQTVALDPKHTDARKMLVSLDIEVGAWSQSREDAKKVYDLRPNDAGAVRAYVEALIRSGEKALAKDVLVISEKDHTAKDNKAEMLLALIEGYALLEDRDEAKRLTKVLVDTQPGTPEGRIAVARALMVTGRLGEAETMLTQELAREGSSPAVAFELGRLFSLTKRTLQSLEYFRKALAGSPNNVQYRLALAQALYETGDLGEADTVLQGVDATNAAAGMLRMQIALLQGRTLDPKQLLEAIGEGKQSGLPLAALYLRMGKAPECLNLCATELKRKPDDPDALSIQGQAQAAMNQLDKAAATFKQLLKVAPSRLTSYLQLASVLAATKPPADVATEMKAVEGAQSDLVDLTTGWLLTKMKKIAEARMIYERLANDDKAPQISRQRARLQLAESLANENRLDDALKQVDLLASDKTWQKPTMEAKARLLVAAKRFKDAEKILQDLRKMAMEEKDTLLLGRLVPAYLQMDQPVDALAVCDQMQSLQPQDGRICLLRAEAYKAQNKPDDVIKALYKAIELQPGDFATYQTLARAQDAFNRPMAALEVLDRMEKTSGTGRLLALFERAQLFARWGLRTQAGDALDKLAQQDVSANPQLQFEIARMLAQIGRKDSARTLLTKIPDYSQLYVPAQMVLAEIAPDSNASLAIIRQYAKRMPADALVHEMAILVRDKRYQEAATTFQAYQKTGAALSEQSAALAVQAMVQLGTRSQAAQVCQTMALAQQAKPMWRQLACLLQMDLNPAEAAKSLPAPSVATIYDTLVGIALAAQTKDLEAGRQWQSLIGPIEAELRKLNPPTVLAGRLKVLAALASGVTGQASTELANASGMDPVESSVAREIVAQATANPKAIPEAGILLKAALANEWGLGILARAWAMDVLKARPTCQWAAEQIFRSGADLETRRQVLALLQPNNCLLAQIIQASVLTDEKQYEKAVEVITAAAKASGDNPALTAQVAMATERAGRLKDAAELYRALYTQTGAPIAANNGAYLVAILWPNDVERLAEAQKWMEDTVKKAPNEPAFRDTLGWIAFRRGDKDNALPNLWAGVRGSPNSPENHFHLGMAEIQAGNKELGGWHLAATIQIGNQMKDENKEIAPSTREAIRMAAQELEKLK